MSTWDSSDRRENLPSDWYKIVSYVKKRDGGRCTFILPKSKSRCPRVGVDVDHIVAGNNHSYSNLRLLCSHHHKKKTSREGHAAKREKKLSKYRKTEDHPGKIR